MSKLDILNVTNIGSFLVFNNIRRSLHNDLPTIKLKYENQKIFIESLILDDEQQYISPPAYSEKRRNMK